jgi:Glycosyltransferase
MSKSLPMQNTVVGHGVNVDVFAPNANATLPSVREPNIILCAGRVRKAKGQHVLLEAANVLQNYKDWALVIVGKVDKPEFLEVLKTLAQKYSIENQVYFIKETKDIVPYYQAAKIAVVPSFTEGFSLVTAEAMACGCTVIATKNVGVHNQLITPNKNGYLVEVANKNALEKKLLLLLEGAAPFLGEQARNTIVSGWSAAQEAKQLMAVYKT